MNKKIIQIESLTAEDIQNQFNQLKNMLNELMNGYKLQTEDEWLTTEQVCKMLNVDRSTTYLWARKGFLQKYGIGNRTYFKKSDILNAMTKL